MSRPVCSSALLILLSSILFLLSGCAYKAPPRPNYAPFVWSVDRDALPGGSLRVWHTATMGGKARFMFEGGDNSDRPSPISLYVFDHPTEGLVLIDTGFGRRTAKDPNDYPGRRISRLLKLEMDEDGAVIDHLADIGKEAKDVKHMILTHMHPDHVGGVEDFPDAALWVSRTEWQANTAKTGTKAYERQPWVGHRIVQQVGFVTASPYGPFPDHKDLFGDGSVILLPSQGHSSGHISVLLNLKQHSFLFTGDAAWVDENWQQSLPKGRLVRELLEDDWKTGMEALWRIRLWSEAYPDLIVVAGHEEANRTRLKAWPDFYE